MTNMDASLTQTPHASGDVLYIPVYLFKTTASAVGGDGAVSQKRQNGRDCSPHPSGSFPRGKQILSNVLGHPAVFRGAGGRLRAG